MEIPEQLYNVQTCFYFSTNDCHQFTYFLKGTYIYIYNILCGILSLLDIKQTVKYNIIYLEISLR